MCLVDLNHNKGEDVRQELSNRYGKDHVDYRQCDVISATELEGMKLTTLYMEPSIVGFGLQIWLIFYRVDDYNMVKFKQKYS